MLASYVLLMLLFSAMKPILPGFCQRWDVLLPFALYFGQRRSFAEGICLTVVAAHSYTLVSSAHFGLHMIHYLFYFSIARLASYVLYANRWYSIAGLVFLSAIMSRITLPLLASAFGHGWPVLSGWNLDLSVILSQPFYGYVVYRYCVTMDAITFKLPPAKIELRGHFQ